MAYALAIYDKVTIELAENKRKPGKLRLVSIAFGNTVCNGDIFWRTMYNSDRYRPYTRITSDVRVHSEQNINLFYINAWVLSHKLKQELGWWMNTISIDGKTYCAIGDSVINGGVKNGVHMKNIRGCISFHTHPGMYRSDTIPSVNDYRHLPPNTNAYVLTSMGLTCYGWSQYGVVDFVYNKFIGGIDIIGDLLSNSIPGIWCKLSKWSDILDK